MKDRPLRENTWRPFEEIDLMIGKEIGDTKKTILKIIWNVFSVGEWISWCSDLEFFNETWKKIGYNKFVAAAKLGQGRRKERKNKREHMWKEMEKLQKV